jgi:hypothetical protein
MTEPRQIARFEVVVAASPWHTPKVLSYPTAEALATAWPALATQHLIAALAVYEVREQLPLHLIQLLRAAQ